MPILTIVDDKRKLQLVVPGDGQKLNSSLWESIVQLIEDDVEYAILRALTKEPALSINALASKISDYSYPTIFSNVKKLSYAGFLKIEKTKAHASVLTPEILVFEIAEVEDTASAVKIAGVIETILKIAQFLKKNKGKAFTLQELSSKLGIDVSIIRVDFEIFEQNSLLGGGWVPFEVEKALRYSEEKTEHFLKQKLLFYRRGLIGK